MYDTLTRVSKFSQCADNLYFFRQEHKSSHASLETEVEHTLAHFNMVKNILLPRGYIKPFIKYLNENYWRNIRNIAPRMTGQDIIFRDRVIALGQELFAETKQEWFTEAFLAPELKPNLDLIPLAQAMRNGDTARAQTILTELSLHPQLSVNKGNAFHTIRRRIKAFFNPISRQTKAFLNELKRRAAQR